MKHLILSFGLLTLISSSFAKESKIVTPESDYYAHIFVARSPNILNWKTPSTLAKTLLKNSLSGFVGKRKITLGHINIEASCNNQKSYMGMHYKDKKEGIKLIFTDKVGLGLLFHNMIGRYDTKEDIDIAKADFSNGKTSIMTLVLNKQQCESLQEYGKSFKDNGEQFNYGLNNNPFISISKKADPDMIVNFAQNSNEIPFGAGCTAFVMSALQELGLYDFKAYNQWYANVRAPQNLIGQYSNQIYHNTTETTEFKEMNINPGKEVSIAKVIFKGKRWAKDSEPGKDIVYYSPNKIYNWVEKTAETKDLGSSLLGGNLVQINKSNKKRKKQAYQLIIDSSK